MIARWGCFSPRLAGGSAPSLPPFWGYWGMSRTLYPVSQTKPKWGFSLSCQSVCYPVRMSRPLYPVPYSSPTPVRVFQDLQYL